ncbi:MAG: FAD-dependent oxidoreductase [Phycisphaerales bacterium]|nr:MAG: FAD-dependent oxidoreductase [Phycisphaerales bacterium]
MSRNESVYDVVVVGAGPAGATAATVLARQGRSVVMVEQDKLPRSASSLGWLNVKAVPVMKELGADVGTVKKQAFTDVTFFDPGLSKSAKPTFNGPAGYVIDRARFDHKLVKAAVAAGATLMDGTPVLDVNPLESEVVVMLGEGRSITGRLLIVAVGRGALLLDRLGFVLPAKHGTIWTAQVDAPGGGTAAAGDTKGSKSKAGGSGLRVAVVLGLERLGSFAVAYVTPKVTAVAINWRGERDQAIPVLVNTCKSLFLREVVPVDLSEAAAQAPLAASPASAALDMETHIGKHTLLVGDAGGFVASLSNEGIYPAMWSARIGAEVVHSALSSPQSQDELMTFESKWRMTMADYLRAPNTDVQFLLPLLFSNQPMADRMGAAFFAGDNI